MNMLLAENPPPPSSPSEQPDPKEPEPTLNLTGATGTGLVNRILRGCWQAIGKAAPSEEIILQQNAVQTQEEAENDFEARVTMLMEQLRPKVEALDLSGLFRGNARHQGASRRI